MAEEKSLKSPKVLIFTAPILCTECTQKGLNATYKGHVQPHAGSRWRKSTVNLSEISLISGDQEIANNRSGDLTDESDIQLEYEPLAIQESVCFYLESEFKNTESSSERAESSFGFETGSQDAADEITSSESLQKEFEDIRCASQRLLVEARGSSVSSNEDRKGVKRKNDKLLNSDCETNAHQLTMEDIYTQDKCPSTSSESGSPAVTKATGSRQVKSRMEYNVTSKSLGSVHEAEYPLFSSTVPNVCDKLTRLKDCTTENSLVNIFFVVTQVNDIRDVQIKSGTNAGSFVAISSLLVADESKSCFKLTLWREASRWTDKITTGDLAVVTSIKVGKWRDEYVAQTSFNSGFYNLHQPKARLSSSCLRLVSQERVNALATWARSEHPYFFGAPCTKRKVQFTEIPHLHDNTLVHFCGRLMSVNRVSPTSSTYRFGDQQLTKIIAVLAERPGVEVQLFLWGRQAAWTNELQEGLGRVWEFQYLTAKYNTDAGCVFLHSTPRSTKTKLSLQDQYASLLLLRFDESGKQRRKFTTLFDLLESQYKGLAEVEAEITSLQFHYDLDEALTVNQAAPVTDQLKEKIDKLVYVGCGSCSRALVQDQNGVYGQCSHCVVTNPHYKYTIDYYFKPLTISLSNSRVSLQVEAFGRIISRLFQDFPAKTLAQKTANALSRDPDSFVDRFVQYTNNLVKGVKRKVLVSCHVTLDENSFIENRTFTLQEIDF